MSLNSYGYETTKNPIAQSFFIDEPSGIFLTKIQLYFKETFPATANLQLPVSVHIRPMRNGMPSDVEILPGSVAYVAHNAVATSNDASVATDFVLEEPVYLNGLTDYAMVVYAETPEYEIWISEIDATVVGSASARVNKNPNLGSLFYSQNGKTFSANQKQDLKFNLIRANFTTSSSTLGKVVLNNASVPRELLDENAIQTFAGDSDVRVSLTNHGLQVGDTIAIEGATAFSGYSADSINGNHIITKVDMEGYEFKMGSLADSDVVGGGENILSTKNMPYSLLWPNITNIKPYGTEITGSFKGTAGKSLAGAETPYQLDAAFTGVDLNKNNISLEKCYVVAADSIADVEISIGAKTAQMELAMSTTNNFVSPVIDLQRTSLTLIDNIIDNQDSAATSGFNVPLSFVSELNAQNGSTPARHITSIVKLAQSAVGLKVILSANKPKPASFDVYFRVGNEGDNLEVVDWTEIASDTNNPHDPVGTTFRDYEYLIGGINGNIAAFTQFQLKIVMSSTNSAQVPSFRDLRVIALSV
tara:strand:+ start:9449 stop:11041 length:1593 start_codon:yes stop_codon:yes gene_type:complete